MLNFTICLKYFTKDCSSLTYGDITENKPTCKLVSVDTGDHMVSLPIDRPSL